MKRLLLAAVSVAAVLPFAHATASTELEAATTAVCHRTTSATRPYVRVAVTARTLRTHTRHAADIIPAPRVCPRTILRPTSGGTAVSIRLGGETEVPAGDPVGTGSATIRLRSGQGQICFVLNATNITLPAAAAHIHRGAAGANGPVVITLRPPAAGGSASGCVAVARTLVRQLLSSRASFYVNVHTSDFPAGAIRGQLAGTAVVLGRSIRQAMTGEEERPVGDLDGTGTTIVRIRRDAGLLCYRLVVQNIQLPTTGAHIHRGPAGVAGPIVIPFEAPGASGTSSGCVTVDGALLDEVLANPANFYSNVHTREFPAGAVRAQLG
jgi:hypothetical protein